MPTDRHDLVSERDPRFLLVRRPDPAQLVKDGGEQLEERFQPFDVLDHPDDLERQLIHVLGELGSAPWNPTSFLNCWINDPFVDCRIRARSSTPRASSGAITGSRPMISGIKPNASRSSGLTWRSNPSAATWRFSDT